MKFAFSLLLLVLHLLLLFTHSALCIDEKLAVELLKLMGKAQHEMNIWKVKGIETTLEMLSAQASNPATRKQLIELLGKENEKFITLVLDAAKHANKLKHAIPPTGESSLSSIVAESSALLSETAVTNPQNSWISNSMKQLSLRKPPTPKLDPTALRNIGLVAGAAGVVYGSYIVFTSKSGHRYLCQTKNEVSKSKKHIARLWSQLVKQVDTTWKSLMTKHVPNTIVMRHFQRSNEALSGSGVAVHSLIALAALTASGSIGAHEYEGEKVAGGRPIQLALTTLSVKTVERMLIRAKRLTPSKSLLIMNWAAVFLAVSIIDHANSFPEIRRFMKSIGKETLGVCKRVVGGVRNGFGAVASRVFQRRHDKK